MAGMLSMGGEIPPRRGMLRSKIRLAASDRSPILEKEALRYPVRPHPTACDQRPTDGETTIAPRSWPTGLELGPHGESCMRFILGIIIGCALTVGVAYVVDSSAPAGGPKMVNWEVVAKNLDTVTTLAREGWKKIAG